MQASFKEPVLSANICGNISFDSPCGELYPLTASIEFILRNQVQLPLVMYQLTLLVKDKVSEADRGTLFDGIKKSFSNLIKEDLWGVRSMAYSIKHNDKAFYGYFEFEAEPKSVVSLDKTLRLNEDIIRYLIVKSKIKKQKAKKGKTEKEVEKVEEADKEEVETKKAKK